MGRQLRFYLLPADVDELLAALQRSVGIRLFVGKSGLAEAQQMVPANLQLQLEPMSHCYLTPVDSGSPAMQFIREQDYWLVDTDEEVIQLSRCWLDGGFLVEGRFYYQIDKLEAGAIKPKGERFIQWAERLFRRTKQVLHYSPELMAYVGRHAGEWQTAGGTLVQMLPHVVQRGLPDKG